MPRVASAKGRAYYTTARRADPMPLSPIDPEWDEITRAWVTLENAAIEVVEDLGIKSFGGAKIGTLTEAVMALRRARCREDAKELMRIALQHDGTSGAKSYVAMIREMVKRIPPEPAPAEVKTVKGKR